ncbi:tRNA (adenosine(37)-N6)-dimethylallyltransferase MiaA [Moritella sp. F3]|uniref:tRNA (adenosine(37)-N6)-dimethylallyltransferase MiaA n=1 Tax=Moritella sp. F3 TaxID=2718882 RepID=UPI0018E0E6EE|nr:tRNA (adenosine(37)-N6)-dimethylallyltransferase MiaA [Moritella sp. F3]GIC78322.1 tRNA dimethylallyltransferase 2 [Moritella sp. F1]GIC83745.1 tRNA dimethylallyltransferase 2 [Moritella sp. F3]
MSQQQYNLIVVLGATASGKTRLGVDLAKQLNGEVISGDSRQVYIGLDIGSGKDLAEYGDVPYHLIDIIEPGKEYNAFQFQRDFFNAFKDINQRNKLPLLVGGTGLYIDAVVAGYEFVQLDKNIPQREQFAEMALEDVQQILLELDSQSYTTTDITVRPRLYRAIEIAQHAASQTSAVIKTVLPEIEPLYFGIKWDRSVLRQRITLRLKERLENGMLEEVEGLLAQGITHDKLEYLGLEYRFVSQYIEGKISYDEMFDILNIAIHKYAKRQDTWFRRMERQGAIIHWLDGTGDINEQAQAVLNQFQRS